MVIEHGDDFAYDCSEEEVVESGDAPLPDGRIDLTAKDVHSFYDSSKSLLSNIYPAPVEVGGLAYPTVEHYWLAMQYTPAAPEGVAPADAVSGVVTAAGTAGLGPICEAFRSAASAELNGLTAVYQGQERRDWGAVREEFLYAALTAKFTQNSDARAELLATGTKTIAMICSDKWAGISAAGGIPTGRNHVGQMLMRVRDEIAADAPPPSF